MKKLLIISSTLLLAACQQSNVTDSETATLVNESQTTDQQIIAKSAESVEMPVAKLASNSLKFTHRTSSERAQVGVPFDIDIDFENVTDSAFKAEFTTTPGLMMSTAKSIDIQAEGTEVSLAKRVTVVPQAEGIYFLNIYKVGAEQQKPSAIKIIVGDKDIKEYMQAIGEVIEQEDGSKVISMKADEG